MAAENVRADSRTNYALTEFQHARTAYSANAFEEASRHIKDYSASINYSDFPVRDDRRSVPPSLSVIVVAYQCDAVLRRCIRSICSQESAEEYEVIVVDNSGRKSIALFDSFDGLLWVQTPLNLLPSEARNVGARFARGEVLVFIDEDEVLERDYLRHAWHLLDSNTYVALRGRMVRLTEDSPTPPAHYDMGPACRPADLNLEGNIAITKAAFQAVDGFDPLMFGHEGLELTARLLQFVRRDSVMYTPAMCIKHDYKQGADLDAKRKRKETGAKYLEYKSRTRAHGYGISVLMLYPSRLDELSSCIDLILREVSIRPIDFVVVSASGKQSVEAVRPLLGRVPIKVISSLANCYDRLARYARHNLILQIELEAEQSCEKLGGWLRAELIPAITEFLALPKKKHMPVRGCQACSLVLRRDLGRMVSLRADPFVRTASPDTNEGIRRAYKADDVTGPPKARIKEPLSSGALRSLQEVPVVSVIVPIYNVEQYLAKCLDSLKDQSFERFEVIGIDDCSTDFSSDVFLSYLNDRRFRLISSAENHGLPGARNCGLMNARGKYIFFLDSDDWVSGHALELLHRIVERDCVDIAIGGVAKYYDEDGREEIPENHGRLMSEETIGSNIYTNKNLFHSVTSWNKLIRKDFITEQGLFFQTSYRRFEDMLTYKWYLSGARISNTSDVTYYYRQRASDVSSSIMQQKTVDVFTDKFASFSDIFEFTKHKGLLLSDVDPLHSPKAMMNLPRAIGWMVPKVFREGRISDDDMWRFMLAFRRLTSQFDPEYIDSLPDSVKTFVAKATSGSAYDAIKALSTHFNAGH